MMRPLISAHLNVDDLDEKIRRINELRRFIAEHSPFQSEPVDLVEWVPVDSVYANDYNPNAVAPPEMELLRLSILADGYTQPIVTMPDKDGSRVVIDGFHRHRVGKELPDVRNRVHSYLPVVRIRQDREERNDRIAATIRHNRARGKHRVDAMSDIVVELKRRNWSEDRIAKELGMEPDEVLRLCQMSGLADLFSDDEFSASWDVIGSDDDDFQGFDESTIESEDDDDDRIYHTWDQWECYRAGFYETKIDRKPTENDANFLRDIPRLTASLAAVLKEWPTSTEHYLSNERMDRITWLRKAAACHTLGLPAAFCSGYNELSKKERRAADLIALEHLNRWLQSHGQPALPTLEDAERTTQPELY